IRRVGDRHRAPRAVLPRSTASLVAKRQGQRTYYCLVESARVGGRPRIVSQRYLGSADEVAARLGEAGPGEPERTRHLAFGGLAAVWGVLERLGDAGIVDEAAGERRGGGPPAGGAPPRRGGGGQRGGGRGGGAVA